MPKGKRALKKKVGDDTAALIDRQLDAMADDKPQPKNAGPLFFEDRSGMADRDDHKNRRQRIASVLSQKGGWGRGVIDRDYDDEDRRKMAERRIALQEAKASKDKVYTVAGEKRKRSGHEFELKKKKIVARRKRRRGENAQEENNERKSEQKGKENMEVDGEESGSDDDDIDGETTNKVIEMATRTGSKGWEGGEEEVYDLWTGNTNSSSTAKSVQKQPVSSQRLRAKYAKALKRYTKEGKWIDHQNGGALEGKDEPDGDNEDMNEKLYKKSKKSASAMIESNPSLLVGMHDGMSYNPLPSAQQALVDEIGSRIYAEERKKHMLAEKVKAIHDAEKESTNALINPDQTIEGIDQTNVDDDDEYSDAQDGPRISRPPVENQKLTRTERNRLEKKKHRQAEEEKKLLEKQQSKVVKQLPSIIKQIEKEKKYTIANGKGEEKVLATRLGPNKLSLSLPIDTPLSDDLHASIREMRASTTLMRDAFQRFQDRRLIESRDKNHYHRRYKLKQVLRNSHRENNDKGVP